MVGSSNANLFASISAGICALWGPLHGGANEAVVLMLEKILADGGDVKKSVDMAKDKKSNFRLMGFGHRVYKNFDPRCTIIKQACDKLLAKMKIRDPLFDIAQELEQVALQRRVLHRAEALSQRRFLFRRHLPGPRHSRRQMFTVLFAMGRLPGWIAHWVEMHQNPQKRICRPRQIYIGPTHRKFKATEPAVGPQLSLELAELT